MWAEWAGSEAGSEIWQSPDYLAKKHEWKWVRMAQKGHTTFQEVFAMVRLMESIQLLTWCVSSAVPLQYINEALATAMWMGKMCPTTTAAPEPERSPTLGPSDSPAHLSETPPSIIPLLPDLPLMGTPLVGCPICQVHSHLHTEKMWLLSQWFTWPSLQQEHSCWLPRGWDWKWSQLHMGWWKHARTNTGGLIQLWTVRAGNCQSPF